MIRKAILALLAAATASAAAPPPARLAAPAPVVHIANFRFGPQTLTVAAGTIVTFVNDDEEPHNVTAADHSYRSPILPPGARYAHQYAAPGDYPYFCALHPHMTGHIVVTGR